MRLLLNLHRAFFCGAVILGLLVLPVPDAAGQIPKGEQDCINTLNKAGWKLARAQAKHLQSCIRAYQGKDESADLCAPTDPKGKIEKAQDRTKGQFQSECSALPGFGPQDPNQVNAAAREKEFELYARVFGSELDALATNATDRVESRCIRAIAKSIAKCEDVKLKEFVKCKKAGLKDGADPIESAVELQDRCLGTGTSQQPDPLNKIQKKCTDPDRGSIFKYMQKNCVEKEVNLVSAFGNGVCAAEAAVDGPTLATCIEREVECAFCIWANATDDLSRGCDLFDNGLTDGSCGAICGDNIVEGSEECDGSDDAACQGECREDCTCPACGDGIQDIGEECDGSDDAACPGACQPDCSCPSEEPNCPQGTEDPIDIAHKASFDAILNRLLSDFWQENGDWMGDMQGDATTFAAPTLFRLGCMESDTDCIAKATATVDWGHSLLIENAPAILQGETPPMFMETVIGAPALIDGYYYTANEDYRSTIHFVLSAIHQLIRADPDFLNEALFSPVVGVATLVYTSVYYSRVTGDASMAEEARVTLDGAIALWWDEESGHFVHEINLADWNQGSMLEALSAVYGYSGEESYRNKAIRLGQWILANLKDQEIGGFLASESSQCKALSGNSFIAKGFLELFSVTGDIQWLDEAEGIFTYLLSEQIYDPTQALCQHHYCAGQGRADYFCTGCNFFFLRNLLRYSELVSGN